MTYHKLTDSDKNLSTVTAAYSKSNVVGLIIINTTNSVYLPSEFANKEGDIPVYTVSSSGGKELESFLSSREVGFIQIKVVSENNVDPLPIGHSGPQPTSPSL